ncbi:MAG TPA: NAD-dependent epimerase/dehydratase family protein [Mycobacteriales bacterium]|nr:NAD-dependent epimerase/dehydratase family protein [Mycobacteriales bacterium]
MRVLLTGATGYVGAFTLRALLDAGHEPRLLVRSRERLAAKAAAVGVGSHDLQVVVGDMTDPAAVQQAVTGADAAIHAAAVVAVLNRADAERALQANVVGTRTVLDAALAAGCDPVVHVSSVIAVFDPNAPVVSADLPPTAHARSPYTRSKALVEQLARERQADGAPVVIVYPGGVTGPAAGDSYGEVAEGFVSMLKAGLLVLDDGGITILDVRDLAGVLVATLQPGLGPRRFMAGGQLTTLGEIGDIVRRLTGRHFPALPTPGVVFRGLGHLTDAVRRVVPFATVFTAEAMDALTLVRPTDDRAVHEQLGITYRDPAESIEASLRALYAGGLLSARQVGALANSSPTAAAG